MRKASYTNHLGITVEFNKEGSPFTLNPLPFRSVDAIANTMSEKITGFHFDGIKSYAVEIGVKGDSAQETADNYDYLISVFETDTLAASPGMLTINEYSLKCFVSGFTPQISMRCGKVIAATVITDNNRWYKELFTMLFTSESSIILDSIIGEYKALKYPYDYPYGYPSEVTVKQVENPALRPAHFRMIIEGPSTSPTIIIAGHTYSVDVSVSKGSRLIIDSRTKAIRMVDAQGNESNVFNKRNRESYIFEKIPVGASQVSFSIDVEKFYITLIDERSYPKWST